LAIFDRADSDFSATNRSLHSDNSKRTTWLINELESRDFMAFVSIFGSQSDCALSVESDVAGAENVVVPEQCRAGFGRAATDWDAITLGLHLEYYGDK
jgi:hypothetical protein